jgi:hypothetical protein
MVNPAQLEPQLQRWVEAGILESAAAERIREVEAARDHQDIRRPAEEAKLAQPAWLFAAELSYL